MATTGEKVTGAISWTLVPRVVQMAASVFTSVLIVRSLGPFDYGTLSVLRTLLGFVTVVVGFGLGQALNRFIPELRVTGRQDAGRSLLYRSLLVQSGVWVVLVAALALLRPLLQDAYPTYADLLLLGVVVSLAEVAAQTVTHYAVASYRTRDMAVATSVGTLALAVATALLLHFGLNVSGVLLGAGIGHALNATLLAAILRRQARRLPPRDRSSTRGTAPTPSSAAFPWRRLFAYSLPWIPNNILSYAVWRQSETLLLGIYRTRVEAGYFDLAYKLPQLVLEFVPNSVYSLVLAGFAETATVARERMQSVIATYYRLLFFVAAPLTVFGLAMGDTLLVRMYGEEMAAAGPYCQAFFVIFTISFFGTPLSMTVYVVEKVWVNLVLNIGYAILTVGLDLILIPRYGLLGATIPTAFVTALTPFVRYLVARRYLGRIEIPWAFIARAFAASSPLLLWFWGKVWVTGLPSLIAALLATTAFTVLSYRWFRVLGPEERAFLARSRVPLKDWILRVL